MTDSVLDSIKKVVGVDADYDVFDPDLVMHINSVFGVLHQLGVGPSTPFLIEDKTATWTEFLGDENPAYASVKSYIQAKVKLLFDPPPTSFGLAALEKVASEYEWRLNVQAEGVKYAQEPRR